MINLKTVAIIQARMGSTRLPGKVLKKLKNKTVLEHVVNRVADVDIIDQIVIATSTLPTDDVIEREALGIGAFVYRGDENDVLSRYYEAAVKYNADNIVRITSDCPLVDTNVTSDIIRFYLDHNYDYVSNCLVRSYPRGLDTEVFSFGSLERAYKEANTPAQREHVTPYIYQNRDKFSVYDYVSEVDLSSYRWTLDTQEDWDLINKIYDSLYNENTIFNMNQVVALMQQNPWLSEINAHVVQKHL